MTEEQAPLERTYAAFNARDVESVLKTMHPDVEWPNGWEGGWVHGREGVREYWRRQWQILDPRVEPVGFSMDETGLIVVEVHQIVRDVAGALVKDQRVQHAYSFEDGLIRRMEIRQ